MQGLLTKDENPEVQLCQQVLYGTLRRLNYVEGLSMGLPSRWGEALLM